MNDSVTERNANFSERAFAALQQCLPTRLISWLIFKLTRIRIAWFKNAVIRWFMKAFNVSLDEAEHPSPEDYEHFNAFFTRALREGARPADPSPEAFLSPVDGTVSQLGTIDNDRIFQAKGHHYTAAELLGNDALAAPFRDGHFCTIYLAPYNYHRIHMPIAGSLEEYALVPGRLFSVNPATARAMPNLFARNERVVTIFQTQAGPMAMVLVGALNVGSMETVWAGQITPPHRRSGVVRWTPEHETKLQRAEEMGRFNMGSTVILLSAPGALNWSEALGPGSVVQMGQSIGTLVSEAQSPANP